MADDFQINRRISSSSANETVRMILFYNGGNLTLYPWPQLLLEIALATPFCD